MYFEQGEKEKALLIAESITNEWSKNQALVAISKMYLEQGEKEKASSLLEKALLVAESIPDEWGKSRVLFGISKMYFEQGETEKASSLLEKALFIAESITNEREKNNVLVDISKIYFEQGEKEKASRVLEKVLNTAESINDERGTKFTISKKDVLLAISKVYLEQGYKENAYAIINKLTNIKEKKECIEGLLRVIPYKNLWQNILYLENYLTEEIILVSVYKIWIERAIENPENILTNIFIVLKKVLHSEELTGLALTNIAIYYKFISENKVESAVWLKKLSNIIDIKDWLPEEEYVIYSYNALNEWIKNIEDEDDRDDIESWAKRVKKGKWTEEEFQEKVTGLLG